MIAKVSDLAYKVKQEGSKRSETVIIDRMRPFKSREEVMGIPLTDSREDDLGFNFVRHTEKHMKPPLIVVEDESVPFVGYDPPLLEDDNAEVLPVKGKQR